MARFVSHTITALKKTPRKTGVTGGFVRRCCCLASCLLSITASTVLCRAEEEKAAPKQPMSVVAILSEDNQGNALRFPSAVAFDPEQEEIYVINGGKTGFVIYDSDLLPHLFLGAGRGIDTPQSIFFDSKEGNLFVCQGKSATHPPRLTILNGAFFPVKEIVFDHIPEAENFSPFRGVLGKTGNIYLADNNTRGVLVLDKDGNFLRWLRPMDSIRQKVERETSEKDSQVKKEAVDAPPPPESPAEADLLDLPPELQPKSRLKVEKSADGPSQGPVMINNIITDSDGHLFLLSEETSKVYAYSVNEDFLFSFGEKGGSTGKMSRPRGIAINEGRKIIYIVDYMRHTILVYDLAGKYLFEFGGRGSGPLWFNFPNSITVDRKGRLIVADLFNNRVQILKTEFDMTFTGSKGLKTDTPATVTPGVPQTFTPTTIMPGTPQTLTPTAVTPSTQQTFTPTTVTTSAPQTITPPEASAPPNNVEVEIGTTSDRHIEDWR